MARVQQIIDDKTGEIFSSRNIKGNIDFVQIYRTGMQITRELAIREPKAFSLFWFLVEQMDKENALIISKETLAELHNCSVRTITRQIGILKKEKFIEVVKSGVNNVYLINASIAWTADGNRKQYAKFRAQVVISATEQESTSTKIKANRTKQLNLI
jgi:hypothetical protein